jgi:hypothetical protein
LAVPVIGIFEFKTLRSKHFKRELDAMPMTFSNSSPTTNRAALACFHLSIRLFAHMAAQFAAVWHWGLAVHIAVSQQFKSAR